MQYILAADQGTTSSRAILFDSLGNMTAVAQREFSQYYPQNGWVEHDANEIWDSQLAVLQQVVRESGVNAADIAAIGITNQRETAVLWERETGEPVCPAIVWQCRRTAELCEQLKRDSRTQMIREKTGLVVDAYFSGTKLKWMLEHIEDGYGRAKRGELLFGTVDSWLIYRLTGGKVHATDVTNASRTMLFNIHTLDWDDDLLSMLDIPREVLPKVVMSSGYIGECDPTIFGCAIPIMGCAGDQHAALFGQTCFERGEAKNTYGTGCFLLMNTGGIARDSEHGLLTTIAWGIDGKINYALEGSIFVAGAVVQWMRDELHLIENAAQSEALAASVPDTGGVVLVPAFTGMGAPYWDMYARGTLLGVTRGTNAAHIVRAGLESIAQQSADVLRAMESDAGQPLGRLLVDGGASANNFLMQYQADLLGTPVSRPVCVETTALGAAYLAGLAAGVWKDQSEICRMHNIEREFRSTKDDFWREDRRGAWRRAVDTARFWAAHE